MRTAPDGTAPAAAESSAPGPASRLPQGPRALIGVVLALTVAVGLMLLAFAAPAVHSGPTDLPLAVAGPPPAVSQVTAALDQARPGAFTVTTYDSADQVDQAIRDREAIGGISVGADGITIHTATAAGAPYAPMLTTIGNTLAAQGQPVTFTDVVPLTADDPAGSGLTALALPLVFGGMASAVALSFVTRRASLRIGGALTFSVLAGLTAGGILTWLGTIDGAYWPTSAAIALGIAAISLTILGLEAVLGLPGLGIGALTMLFVANPLSGVATGPLWLPQPWGAIGQFLPVGAAGTTIRSAAFFDGAGATTALLVLVAWACAGLVLVLLGARRSR